MKEGPGVVDISKRTHFVTSSVLKVQTDDSPSFGAALVSPDMHYLLITSAS